MVQLQCEGFQLNQALRLMLGLDIKSNMLLGFEGSYLVTLSTKHFSVCMKGMSVLRKEKL